MKSFLGKKILLFTAHPDDESYVAAGTIYANHQQGGETVLLCASLGEKGTSHLRHQVTAARLKQLRKQELLKAARVLHIRRVVTLGLPDGQLRQHLRALFMQGRKLASKFRPDVILSFGPDGISGHFDHVAVGQAAKKISQALRIPLVTATLPVQIARQAVTFLATRRRFRHYQRAIRYTKPALKIMIDSRVKKRALRCHRSQMDGRHAFTGFPTFAVKALLRAEYFVAG